MRKVLKKINNDKLFRKTWFSLLNSHKYKKDSIIYPYVNFRLLFDSYLFGNVNIEKRFDLLKSYFSSKDGEMMIF